MAQLTLVSPTDAECRCGMRQQRCKRIGPYERFDVGPTHVDSDTDTAYRYGYVFTANRMATHTVAYPELVSRVFSQKSESQI